MPRLTPVPKTNDELVSFSRPEPDVFSKLLSEALSTGKPPSRHELRLRAALDVERAVLMAEKSGQTEGKDAYAGALALAKIRTQQLALLSPLLAEQTGHSLDALLALVEAAPERTGPTADLEVTVTKKR